MPVVLGVASTLGIAGVFASFGLFYLGERVFHLSREVIQSLMYLKLSVAGSSHDLRHANATGLSGPSDRRQSCSGQSSARKRWPR